MKKLVIILLFALTQISWAQWEQCNNGLINLEITSISFVDNKIIVTSNGGGIYETTDEGNFWTKINNGINNKKILSFDADDSTYVAGTDKSIFFSFDKGKSWTQRSAILNLKDVNNIKINKKRIFDAIGEDGNYVSDDYGETWKPLNIPQKLKVFHNDTIIGYDYYGFIFSFDNGNTWIYKEHNLGFSSFSDLILKNHKLFALSANGLYVSENFGDTWVLENIDVDVNCKKMISYDKYLILIDNHDGIMISSNDGISWKPLNESIIDYTYKFTALNAKDDKLIVGTIRGDIYISDDFGTTWINKNNGIYQDISAMTIQNNNLIASIRSGSGVYCSSDSGLTWINNFHFESNREVYSLFADKDYIYAGSWSGDFFVSSDQGNSWLKKSVTSKYGIIKAICKKGNLLFAGHESAGVYVSTDEGDTWVEKTEYMWNKSVNALALSGSRLYAGTEGGIFLSTDYGETWTYKKTWLAAQKIQCLTANGTDLFAGSSDGGLILSTDNGDSWKEINNGLSTKSITSVVVKGNYVFAATQGNGVYLSRDYGINWRAINSGFYYLFISSLVILDDRIYAGCQESGVYYAKLSDFGITDVKDEKLNENELMISPNPANDHITINLSGIKSTLKRGVDEVIIYNTLGLEIKHFPANELNGQNTINFSINEMPSGVYYCTFTMGTENFTKSFLVIK